VIVRGIRCRLGTIVTCLRLHASQTIDVDGVPLVKDRGPRWVVDPPVLNAENQLLYSIADLNLKPLRDTDGEDEILRLVGKPQGLTPIPHVQQLTKIEP
jgi:hypothetical protein